MTAAGIDRYLQSKASPLVGAGAAFLRAGVRYHVDPRLIVAIAGAESYFGLQLCAPYNAWGWGCPDGPVRFASWEDAIDAIADIAVSVNASVENIGARRLQTVMERVLDEVSFTATDRAGETVHIDAVFVQKHIGDLAKNTDLSRFIL